MKPSAALVCTSFITISISNAFADAGATVELPPALRSPACVACKVDAAQARSEYTDAQWKSLENREVVISEVPSADSNEQRKVSANAIIHRSPKQVWAVLTDFPSRPKFLTDVKEMRVVRVDGQRVWVDEYLSFLFVDIYFRVINALDAELGTMRWELDKSVENDIADSKGLWKLTPAAGGTHTLLSYWNDVDTGQPIPGFIENYLLDSSLPGLLGRLRDEVERRYATSS